MLAWTGNFSLTIVIAVDGIDSELRCGRLSLSLSKRLPGREEAKPARRCPRGSAGPGERRRGLLVAVLVAAPARESGGVACSSLSLSLSSFTV